MIFNDVDCFMMKKDTFGAYICTGNIKMEVCGKECPFRHSDEEQARIENRIVKMLFNKQSHVNYQSRLTGKLLYRGEYGE